VREIDKHSSTVSILLIEIDRVTNVYMMLSLEPPCAQSCHGSFASHHRQVITFSAEAIYVYFCHDRIYYRSVDHLLCVISVCIFMCIDVY
jgi:hypothetical protein